MSSEKKKKNRIKDDKIFEIYLLNWYLLFIYYYLFIYWILIIITKKLLYIYRIYIQNYYIYL